MKFGNIDKVILFGGSSLLSEFAQYLFHEQKVKVVVFSSKRHLDEVHGKNNETMAELLKNAGIFFFSSNNINISLPLRREITKNTLGIAFGAAWIFEKRIAQLFKQNYLLDFMGIDLPRYRGGAHWTWQILHRNKKGCLNLQVIYGGKEKFHRGEVLKQWEYSLPSHLKTPKDYFNFIVETKGYDFLIEFWRELKMGKNFSPQVLNEKKSSYYPPLFTRRHGAINWDWSGEDIFLFLNAFDDPYDGAFTWWRGKKVFLKGASLSAEEEDYHPFTSGIIVRKNMNHICIATKGKLLCVRSVRDEAGKDMIPSIELGERFVTPPDEFYKSLNFQAVYDAKGLICKKKR